MKKAKSILWGLVLAAAGVLLGLRALDIVDFSIFFDGWWTLFLIVPCAIGLVTDRDKTGNLVGLAIGVFLLLACQDVVGFDKLWKLLVPAIIVIIGLKMVFRGIFGSRTSKTFVFRNPGNRNTFAAFSGQTVVLEKETFEGAEVSAVFGGVEYDLRKALITQDCGLKVSAIFGGIDILVPDNVNVVVNCTSILGGIDNMVPPRPGCPTLYISGTCMFGGVDVK